MLSRVSYLICQKAPWRKLKGYWMVLSSEDVQSEQAYRESDAVSDVAVSRVCRRPRTDEQTVSRIGTNLHHPRKGRVPGPPQKMAKEHLLQTLQNDNNQSIPPHSTDNSENIHMVFTTPGTMV